MSIRPGMVRWYDPSRLISTAIRVAISTVFGELADRREAMAASREIDPQAIDPVYDYSAATSGFWFDFVADTGDGWNPTYAIARLVAAESLAVEGQREPLPLGQVLIMGGDQVYPAASRQEYAARFVAPFDEAAKIWPKNVRPDIYAIPGNHDWYDGLLAFLGLFCRRRRPSVWASGRPGRVIGGRQSQQTRSYFAIKLPHDWWLWGVDIQLAGYIDQPQIDFFTHVAKAWMAPGSRLILCTGQPSWAYVDTEAPEKAFKNFSYLEGLLDLANRNHHLCLVLTGDSHHYSRYTEGPCHYVTAGGGGAFLHPTHHLKDKIFKWDYPPPGTRAIPGVPSYRRVFRIARDVHTNEPRVFPPPSVSRRLSWRTLAFAILNWQYSLALGLVCGIFAWLLDTNARIDGGSLSSVLRSSSSLWEAWHSYLQLVLVSPWPALLVVAAVGGYYYLSDFKRRLLSGVLHSTTQIAVIVTATILLAFHAPDWGHRSLLIAYVATVGGFLSATVMGVYLLVSVNMFGKHWNEAFSALRIENYKCFLRMCIDRGGTLTIYPIGLDDVPRDDFADPPLKVPLTPHLIEPPIVIVGPVEDGRASGS